MDDGHFKRISQAIGALAVVVSLVFVGYELQRTNDIAVVQSQHELLALQADMKSWLIDPEVVALLMTDRSELSTNERLVFDSLVGAWFDVYEAAYIASDRNILTDAQFKAWKNGLCTLPKHWFRAFRESINQNNYIQALVEGARDCE